MPKVISKTDNKTLDVENNEKLVDVCTMNSLSVPFACTDGVCGTCLISVTGGLQSLSEKTEQEKITLETIPEKKENSRLACQCIVKGDIEFENGREF